MRPDHERHIFGFDAFRAFSVLLVIASHVGVNWWYENPFWTRFFEVFNAGYGVRTFFVLSGFLLTTILIGEYEARGKVSVPYFMIKRALRILPLYFLILFLIIVLVKLGIAYIPNYKGLLYSTFFIFNFIPRDDNVNFLSHLWSLAVEEQFYILWPLVFAVLFRSKAVLGGACLAVIAVCYWRMTSDNGPAAQIYYTPRWTIPAIYPILIGCVYAIAISYRGRTQAVLASPAWLVLSLGLVILPLVVTGHEASIEVAGAFGIGGIVAWTYLNQKNAVVRRLDTWPIGYIGTISYGLYMWQGFFTGNGTYRIGSWPPDVWTGALLTFIAAPLSFHLYEQWFTRQKYRFRFLQQPRGNAITRDRAGAAAGSPAE